MNIRNGDAVVVDIEGEYYATLELAHLGALADIRELGADALKSGQTLCSLNVKIVEIQNKSGRLLKKVPFCEAFGLPQLSVPAIAQQLLTSEA